MKGISRFLSVFLVLALILSCSACASGTFTAPWEEEDVEELIIGADSTTELFVPLTEKTSKSLAFPLSEEQAAQVRNYDRYYDENYLVVGSTHALHAAEHVPEYWGILSVELIKGRIDFYRVREAAPNPKARLQNKMSLLWKSEFSHILAENSMPKYAQKSKKFITEKLISKVPAEVLHEQISEELFERDYTIYD